MPLMMKHSTVSLNEKGELNAISQLPVICEYQDVFPEELLGMPPHRPVEFVIDLEPGTEPVFKRPYKLGPEELKELKKQLDEQERLGLIRPSSSPWGCGVLFVKKKDGTRPTLCRLPSIEQEDNQEQVSTSQHQ